MFPMTASSAVLAAISLCRESGSARVSSMYCGKYQGLAHSGSRRHRKYSLLVSDTLHIQQTLCSLNVEIFKVERAEGKLRASVVRQKVSRC